MWVICVMQAVREFQNQYPLKYERKHFWMRRLNGRKGINVITEDSPNYGNLDFNILTY